MTYDYVSQSTYYNINHLTLSGMKGQLKRIADSGCKSIHWSHEWNGTYQYSIAEMHQIREWMDQLGLSCHSIHASDGVIWDKFSDRKLLFHYEEPNRKAAVELVKNRMDFAKILGANVAVLHVELYHNFFEEYKVFEETFWPQLFKSFDELVEYTKETGVIIAVENQVQPRYLEQIDQVFDKLYGRYTPDELAFTLDVGHAILTGDTTFEYLKRYQNRLRGLHLQVSHTEPEGMEYTYENICNLDKHMTPTRENFDFETFAKLVADSVYDLPIVMELMWYKDLESEAEFLDRANRNGNEIGLLVEKYRRENQ